MDTNVLAIFVDVMRLLSFADVARLRGLAPSSVSRSIAQMETDLGVRLFHRSTRKLEPTEEAHLFCERVRPLIEGLDEARELLRDAIEKPLGKLRMTVATVYAQTCIAPLMPAFAQRYPELDVELIITDAYLDLVGEHIDLAIRLGSLRDSGLVARRLHDLHFHVCASPGYLQTYGVPAAPDELSRHECLRFHVDEAQPHWLFEGERGDIQRVAINGRYLMTSSSAVLTCAEAGMGIALLPDWLVSRSLQAGTLISLFPERRVARRDLNSAAWMVFPSRNYVPRKTRVMMEFLAERLAP